METKTIEVYHYDELDENSKDKAVEYFSTDYPDYEWWDFLDLNELLPDRITKLFNDKQNIVRALDDEKSITKLFVYKKFYFDFDRENYITFEGLDYTIGDILRKFLRIPKRLWYTIQDYGGIYYDGDKGNTIKFGEDLQFTDKETIYIERAEGIFNDLMDKALKTLKDEYEYICSREAIEDNIRNNDYKFTKDGRLFK